MAEDDGQSSKKKSKRFRLSQKSSKRINSYFGEYCQHTSIHGFQYLGEPQRSCLEKLWWFITLNASIIICGYLILQAYEKWERSPVIVSFATKQTPMFEIPFPAVTVCPEVKFDKNKLNYTALVIDVKKGIELDKTQKLLFDYVSLICHTDENYLKNESEILDLKILKFFDEIIQPFNETSISCNWLDKEEKCENLFKPIVTDEGVCYSFNMLDRSEIFTKQIVHFKEYFKAFTSTGYNLEKGYDAKESKNSYPRRALYPGSKAGLMIKLKTLDKDLDDMCGNSLQGYKILLHHPSEVPRVSQQYFRLPLNQAVVAALTPEMIRTTPSLQNYDPDKRQCFFQNERDLASFKIYSQRNCEIECLANHTFHFCGCVDFHMPRTVDMPICGPAKIKCMHEMKRILLNKEIDLFLDEKQKEQESNLMSNINESIAFIKSKLEGRKITKSHVKHTCNCLPSCTSISYNAETSQSEWYWKNTVATFDEQYDRNKINSEHRSMLVIYFKDTQFIPSERDELYGHVDFLANCGGLLGLFMGFSFISVVEIIYFLSLRLCCNIRLYGRKFWHGSIKN